MSAVPDLAEVAADVTEYLKTEIGLSVENKETSTFMQDVALGMDLAGKVTTGLATSDAFLNRYATTIGTVVYLPKVIRENPRSVLEVLPHEGQHGIQFQASRIKFPWLYLTDATDRAQLESDAYATGLCVRSWLSGLPIPEESLQWILTSLVEGYHLRATDRDYAQKALLSHIQSIKDGIYMTASARATIARLESRYPQVRGTVRF